MRFMSSSIQECYAGRKREKEIWHIFFVHISKYFETSPRCTRHFFLKIINSLIIFKFPLYVSLLCFFVLFFSISVKYFAEKVRKFVEKFIIKQLIWTSNQFASNSKTWANFSGELLLKRHWREPLFQVSIFSSIFFVSKT